MLGHNDRQCEEYKGTYRIEEDKRSLPDVTCPTWKYLHMGVCPLHGPGTPPTEKRQRKDNSEKQVCVSDHNSLVLLHHYAVNVGICCTGVSKRYEIVRFCYQP